MPINVPNTPKVYTTKYYNWRGVDYTNDPSNVWYRRSPNGVNMLPHLDGQPFKRSGWKIEFTSADFCDAAGVAEQSVEQYKVDYFELGGAEYLFFFTSLGCFYYSNELTYIDKSWELPDDDASEENSAPFFYRPYVTYDEGDYVWNWDNTDKVYYKCTKTGGITTPEAFDATHWTEVTDIYKSFPPEGTSIDHNKAFFFEGGGRAAYYLFADEKMYWFDGSVLHEAHPHFPLVLYLCNSEGAGELLEDVNLLTDWRIIQYECDGSTTTFTVPDGFETDEHNTYPTGILAVYLRNSLGGWDIAEYGTSGANKWYFEGNVGQIKMTSAPVVQVQGEDNLRIIYKPSGISSITTRTLDTNTNNFNVERTRVEDKLQTKGTNGWTTNSTTVTDTYINVSEATFNIPRPKRPLDSHVKRFVHKFNSNGTYGAWIEDTTKTERVYNAYGDKVIIRGVNNGKDLFESNYNEFMALETSRTTKEIPLSQTRRHVVTTTKSQRIYSVFVRYDTWEYSQSQIGTHRNAFFSSSKVLIFGNGIVNQIFLTASTADDYSTRVWYSAATDPLYFPDRNYMEVGATDKPVMGLIKVGDYLGIIKQGSATDTSIYLAYPTSFDETTTYAVKQSVNGIGAISNGAFNILNDEPLFLSAEGVMGIEPAENEARKIRNRSYYVNKKLKEEPGLSNAFSFVYDGMYWLGVNNHCYVLDGSQKTSWENTKTNLQYECYYLENVPARCFAKMNGRLWFIDGMGNVCRFRDDMDELRYVDAYDIDAVNDADKNIYKANSAPTLEDGNLTFDIADTYERESETKVTTPYLPSELEDIYENGLSFNLSEYSERDIADVAAVATYVYPASAEEEALVRYAEFTTSVVDGDTIISISAGDSAFSPAGFYSPYFQIVFSYSYNVAEPQGAKKDDIIQYDNEFYTVKDVIKDAEGETLGYIVVDGVPIPARWGTIADDDGSAHYFKNLQKKGSIVAVMPMSDSGVKVSVIPDEKEPILVGETDVGSHTLPFSYYMKKKIKKYKRLQIVCENESYNDGFGIDEIIKSYTMGNYAKK